jgi:hypothetical protein
MHRAWSKRPYLFNVRVLSRHKLLMIKVGLSLTILVAAFMPLIISYLRPSTAHATASLVYNYTNDFKVLDEHTFGSANASTVATDSNDNVYVAGDFSGPVQFNPTDPSTRVTSNTIPDSDSSGINNPSAFLTEYNSSGTYISTETLDANAVGASAYATGVAIDSSGDVFVTGYFDGTVIFDGPGGTHSISSTHQSVFLTEYNSSGAYISTQTFGTAATGATASATGVAVDSSGDVFVTGYFDGTVIFDGPSGSHSTNSTNQSAFLTEYNSSGTYISTQTFGTAAGGATASATGVAIDSSGDVYMTGIFQGTVIFDGPSGSHSYTDPNIYRNDTFLTEYTPNGSGGIVYMSTRILDLYSSNAYADATSVAVDSSSNVYIAGTFCGTVVFDGVGGIDSQTCTNTDGNNGSFLTKIYSNGSYGWTDITASSGYDSGASPRGVATDSNGNIYVTGGYFQTVDFGASDDFTASYQGASFLTDYNSDGSYGWTYSTSSAPGQGGSGADDVAVASNGNVYSTGGFYETVTFGGSDTLVDNNNGYGTTFLTDYVPATATIDVTAGNGGSTSPTGDQVVSIGDSLDITVTPSIGYSYTSNTASGGTVNCSPSGDDEDCVMSDVTANGYFTANFSEITQTITGSVTGLGSITLSGITTAPLLPINTDTSGAGSAAMLVARLLLVV